MLDEIGCLASILSITLTLYDDVQVEPGVAEINLDRQEEEEEEEPALPGSAEGFASALRSRKRDKKQAPNEGTSPCYAEEAMTRTPKAGSCCCASCFRLVGGTTIAFCMANALDILFPREVHLKLTTMQPSSGFSSELCSLFILFLSPHFSS
eukprot:g25492.t1